MNWVWGILMACGSFGVLMWAWKRHVRLSDPKRTTYRLREAVGAEAVEPKLHAKVLE